MRRRSTLYSFDTRSVTERTSCSARSKSCWVGGAGGATVPPALAPLGALRVPAAGRGTVTILYGTFQPPTPVALAWYPVTAATMYPRSSAVFARVGLATGRWKGAV